ncbi:MAG: CBS domain-containing protein, partial [Lentisphaeraceae bacterium]|nr:CBS domain-containing protein [Lentisphaeraceae bacterium]
VIFFVLVGAKIDFGQMPGWLWIAVVMYVVMRSLGKMYGARIGAKFSKADPKVCQYLGMSLIAQGGIAIGLSATAGVHLNKITLESGIGLGDVLIFGITATTFLVQFLGPAMVKYCITKADESGRDVTEGDVTQDWKVENVIEKIEPIQEGMPLTQVMMRFTTQNVLSFPVVNKKNEVTGIISLEHMKDLLTDQASWMWILTADVMEPTKDFFYTQTPLEDALNRMHNVNIEQVPVLCSKDEPTLSGLMSLNHAKVCISRELLKRQGEVTHAV